MKPYLTDVKVVLRFTQPEQKLISDLLKILLSVTCKIWYECQVGDLSASPAKLEQNHKAGIVNHLRILTQAEQMFHMKKKLVAHTHFFHRQGRKMKGKDKTTQIEPRR